MPRRSLQQRKIDMAAAVQLVAEGKKQVEIAKLLDLHETNISRLLKAAEGKYISTEIRILPGRISDELRDKAQKRINRSDLSDKIHSRYYSNSWGPVVRVFHCSAPLAKRTERIYELSQQAAPYIRELIFQANLCGVTWGAMLRGVVSELQALHISASRREGGTITFVPLCGEPLGNDPTSFSSSSLTHDLSKLINGKAYTGVGRGTNDCKELSLAMVPAFIPEDFSREQTRGVWNLINLVWSYRFIFGEQPYEAANNPNTEHREVPAAMRLDMILSSLGPSERPFGFGPGVLFETGSVTIEDLKSSLIGEVGGVCFPKHNLPRYSWKKLRSVISRWTGLRMEHLRGCAERAKNRSKGIPGVVIVTRGKDRAQVVHELLKQGLINHLLIDDELAKELEKLIDATE